MFFFMKISEGSKIPLIPKSLSFLPGWKCRNNLLAIILALIFKPLARMKMAHIYMPHIYVPVWKWGRVKIRLWSQLVPHLCLEVQRDIQSSTTILSQEKYSFFMENVLYFECGDVNNQPHQDDQPTEYKCHSWLLGDDLDDNCDTGCFFKTFLQGHFPTFSTVKGKPCSILLHFNI